MRGLLYNIVKPRMCTLTHVSGNPYTAPLHQVLVANCFKNVNQFLESIMVQEIYASKDSPDPWLIFLVQPVASIMRILTNRIVLLDPLLEPTPITTVLMVVKLLSICR